jgi:hypothetical protein
MYIFDDLLAELIQCVLNSINRFPVNIITDCFCNGDSTNDVNYGRKVDYGSERLNAATFHGGDHRLTCLFRLALLYEAYFRSRYAVILRLKGTSMYPLLRNGKDVVVLGKCPAESLQPMDVVLFRYRGKHVLHRIIRREGERLLIQGDGSIVAKEECTVDDVVGKVVQICRPSGKEIPVGSWQWTIPGRVWRGLGFLRIWLLRVAYRLFLRPVK